MIQEVNSLFRKGQYYASIEKINQNTWNNSLGIGLNKYLADKKINSKNKEHKLYTVYQYSFSALNKKKRNMDYVVGMATMPSRIETLEQTINSVLPQVDKIHVYLNNFISVPDFLINNKIEIYLSQDTGDLRDNGKFFGLESCKNYNAIFFTIDDDLYYPPGYFNALAVALEHYNDSVAVGVHGVIYPKDPSHFFDRISFHFGNELREDIPVSVLGTGTVAIPSKLFPRDLAKNSNLGMADLIFAERLKKMEIPAICISRPEKWLSELSREDKSDTIYQETKNNHYRHSDYLKVNSPWGVEKIINLVTKLGLVQKFNLETIDLLRALSANIIVPDSSDSAIVLPLIYTGEMSSLNYMYFQDLSLKHLVFNRVNKKDSIFIEALKEKLILLHEKEIATLVNLSADEELYQGSILLDKYVTNASYDFKSRLLYGLSRNRINLLEAIDLLFKSYTIEDINFILTSDIITYFDNKSILFLEERMLLNSSSLGTNIINSINIKKIENLSDFVVYLVSRIFNQDSYIDQFKTIEKFTVSERQYRKDLHKFLDLIEASQCKIDTIIIKLLVNSKKTPLLIKHRILKKAIDIQLFENYELYKDLVVELQKYIETLDSDEQYFFQAELSKQTAHESLCTLNRVNEYNKQKNISYVSCNNLNTTFFNRLFVKNITVDEDYGLCSVIITAYNSNDTIQYAYNSICNQTYKNIEIIIVDDCSDTPIANTLVLNSHVKTLIIRNELNSGPYISRNNALAKVKGEYVTIQDADDWSHPQRIGRQISLLQDNKIACYTEHIRFSEYGNLKLENNGEYLGHGPMTSLFKSFIFSEIGLFSPVRTRGDIEFKQRIIRIYGDDALAKVSGLLLFSLDWNSNSKQYTHGTKKKADLSFFKHRFNVAHNLLNY